MVGEMLLTSSVPQLKNALKDSFIRHCVHIQSEKSGNEHRYAIGLYPVSDIAVFRYLKKFLPIRFSRESF